MENRRKIWRKNVEYSSSFWCSYPFGLCVIILNWSNNRDYVLGKGWLCSSKKNWLRFWWKIGSVFAKQVRLFKNQPPTLGKWATDFGKISRRLCENEPPTLGKSATDFGKMSHPLWENQPPTVRKWATDFGKISDRLWENQPPTLGKSATDFGKISLRLWENQPPTLGKSATDFGKWATHFAKISHRLRENQPPILGKWASGTHGNLKQIISKNIFKYNNLRIYL